MMMLLTVLAQPWQIMTMMTTEVDCFIIPKITVTAAKTLTDLKT